ncbi:hypothetical protein [Limnohabitans sp. Bal53]|uniref:hypothetical protein n=1 Tax=Limnohabitans sp. Bal53 TaxID=1977910 RepID=UPI0011B238F8|nr:hypothetical protein [Limnohabitans sp. Bal53]
MKYPQAYVFFKAESTVTFRDIRLIYGTQTDMELMSKGKKVYSALEKRESLARRISQGCSSRHRRQGSCLVVSTQNLNSLFITKYSFEIDDVVWMSSSQDFKKLRSGLAVFKNYWLFMRGLNLTVRHYKLVSQILGTDCPEFVRNNALFAQVENHMDTLDADKILQSMKTRLEGIARLGKYHV